jgi:hypothetical protein
LKVHLTGLCGIRLFTDSVGNLIGSIAGGACGLFFANTNKLLNEGIALFDVVNSLQNAK